MTLTQINEAPRKQLQPFHIEIRFGPAVSNDVQGCAMLRLERYIRETLGVPAEVYKETMDDDLKRRRDMTPEERDNL